MREIERVKDDVFQLVIHQLHSIFIGVDKEIIAQAVPKALQAIEDDFRGLNNSRLNRKDDIVFNTDHTVTWMIFLYRLSHELGTNTVYRADISTVPAEADKVYYLNKVLHSNDWYHQVNLPIHFICEHPLGSVLGRAKYGDYLTIYQGITIGGNRNQGKLFYPELGNNVVLYANATVLGDSHIGNNVIISADSYLINETIPDNCIVFGKSPNIQIKVKSEEEIKDMTSHIWKW